MLQKTNTWFILMIPISNYVFNIEDITVSKIGRWNIANIQL